MDKANTGTQRSAVKTIFNMVIVSIPSTSSFMLSAKIIKNNLRFPCQNPIILGLILVYRIPLIGQKVQKNRAGLAVIACLPACIKQNRLSQLGPDRALAELPVRHVWHEKYSPR